MALQSKESMALSEIQRTQDITNKINSAEPRCENKKKMINQSNNDGCHIW